jgi:hypothetical protein
VHNTRALVFATLLGALLQVAMVAAGHTHPGILHVLGFGGMSFSLIAGLAYALLASGSAPPSQVLGGLIAGGLCALIGIILSYVLGDVPVTVLLLGTAACAVTGAIGGRVGERAGSR